MSSKTQDIVEAVYASLRKEVSGVNDRLDTLVNYTERSEVAGGLAADTFANLPLAVDGGLSDGTNGIDLMWVTDGRKSGEGVGAGTGVMAFYNTASNTWKRLTDNTDVVI